MKNRFLLWALLPSLLLAFWGSGCESLIDILPEPVTGFIKFYGGTQNQTGHDLKHTADGGFILLGSTASAGSGGSDIYLVKTDSLGNMEWEQPFGGPFDDTGRSIQIAESGQYYMIAGERGLTISEDSTKIILLKVSLNGEEEGSLVLKENINSVESVSEIRQVPGTSDFLVIGTTSDVDSAKDDFNPLTDFKDIYIARVRIPATGTPELVFEHRQGFASDDQGVAVFPYTDDTYDILGTTRIPGLNHTDILFSRISPDGIPLISTQIIGLAGFNERATSWFPTGDGYLITATRVPLNSIGGISGFNYLRIDPKGNVIWSCDRPAGAGDDRLANMFPDLDIPSDFIIAGTSQSFSQNGGRDFYIARVGSDCETRWTSAFGSDGDETMGKAIALDKGYAFVGTNDFQGNTMMSLIKINLDGEIQ